MQTISAQNCKDLHPLSAIYKHAAGKQLHPGTGPYLTAIADLSPAKVLVLALFAKPVRLLVSSHGATCTNRQSDVQSLLWL